MAKIHAFVAKYTRYLKWIPWVNVFTLLYWTLRSTFITHTHLTFGQVMKVFALFLGTALIAIGVSWLLTQLIPTLTQDRANNIVMPLYVMFVGIPYLITMEVKAEQAAS